MSRLSLYLLQVKNHNAQWNHIYYQASQAQDAVNMLCWFLAAIFGVIGSIKVYNRWQLDNRYHVQVASEITFWFAGCIFFIIAHFCIGLIFGLHGKGF